MDKLLRYIIVNIDYKKLLIINLKSEKVIEIFDNDNILNLLGFFFINNKFSPTYTTDDIKFSLIYTNKVGYYKINITNNNEKITEIKSLKVSLIKSFYYDTDFLVLAIEKKGMIFEFYNLILEKNFIKPHEFILPLKNSNYILIQNLLEECLLCRNSWVCSLKKIMRTTIHLICSPP